MDLMVWDPDCLLLCPLTSPFCPVPSDDDSTGDSWELRQRQRQELVEPLREEVRQAMAKLQEEFKQGESKAGSPVALPWCLVESPPSSTLQPNRGLVQSSGTSLHST